MGRDDEQIGLMVGVRDRLDARMSEWLKSPAIKAALHQVEQTTMEPREECETGCGRDGEWDETAGGYFCDECWFEQMSSADMCGEDK